MGKPFKDELEKLLSTIKWAGEQDVTCLSKFLFVENRQTSLVCIGSGGSLSACHYAAQLYQRRNGVLAEAITPKVDLFNKCVEVADIVKFSDQRIKDIQQFEGYKGKLIIQTQGVKGLIYRLNAGWMHLEPVLNDNVVDTAGAGDWTAAALINRLYKDREVKPISYFSQKEIETALNEAQKIGAQSCSFEGARGMMQTN